MLHFEVRITFSSLQTFYVVLTVIIRLIKISCGAVKRFNAYGTYFVSVSFVIYLRVVNVIESAKAISLVVYMMNGSIENVK